MVLDFVSSQRAPNARYMAPELLAAFRPQEGTAGPQEETADSTFFSQSTPLIPASNSVSLPHVSHNSHIKDAAIVHDDVCHDDKFFADTFEGIEDVGAAQASSLSRKHSEKGGGKRGDFVVTGKGFGSITSHESENPLNIEGGRDFR